MIKLDYDQTNHSCGSLHRRGDLGVHSLSDHAHVDLASLTPRKTTRIRHLKAINSYPILLQYALASTYEGCVGASPER